MMPLTPIYVSQGFYEEVGGTITELSGQSIVGDTVKMGLSTDPETLPTVWNPPTTDTSPTPSTRLVMYQIISPLAPGTYWLWVWIQDGNDRVPMKASRSFRVI
jgi:hypothetical protein